MENHANMAIQPFDVGEKGGVIGHVLLASEIHFPPSDQRSGLAALQTRQRIGFQALRAFQQLPSVAALLDPVDVPCERGHRSVRSWTRRSIVGIGTGRRFSDLVRSVQDRSRLSPHPGRSRRSASPRPAGPPTCPTRHPESRRSDGRRSNQAAHRPCSRPRLCCCRSGPRLRSRAHSPTPRREAMSADADGGTTRTRQNSAPKTAKRRKMAKLPEVELAGESRQAPRLCRACIGATS